MNLTLKQKLKKILTGLSLPQEYICLDRHRFTEPLQVYFNLEFIPSDGEWKLIGINVKVGDPK